jgi:hypothetical protein
LIFSPQVLYLYTTLSKKGEGFWSSLVSPKLCADGARILVLTGLDLGHIYSWTNHHDKDVPIYHQWGLISAFESVYVWKCMGSVLENLWEMLGCHNIGWVLKLTFSGWKSEIFKVLWCTDRVCNTRNCSVFCMYFVCTSGQHIGENFHVMLYNHLNFSGPYTC